MNANIKKETMDNTNPDINTGNKFIADYVGVCDFIHPNGYLGNVWDFHRNLPERHGTKYSRFRVQEMMFHENWEWLMFAINVLPDLYRRHYEDCTDYDLGLVINEHTCSIEICSVRFSSFVHHKDNMILALWYCLKAHIEAIHLKST